MKNRKIIFWTFTALLVAGSVFLSSKIIHHASKFKEYRFENAKILDGKERVTDWKEWLSFLGLNRERQNESRTADENAAFEYSCAIFYSYILVGAMLVYLLGTILLFKGFSFLYYYTTLSLLVIAGVCLVLGVLVPMMEFGAFLSELKFDMPEVSVPLTDITLNIPDKEFSGKMFFFYQNKSIYDVIGLLFSSGNFVVGLFILLFSLFNPIIKLFFTLFLLLKRDGLKNKFLIWLVENLGKWSMADVMVVSIILAFLTFQNTSFGVDTEAHYLLGVYFFMAFVIISIISSMTMKMALKKQKDTIILP